MMGFLTNMSLFYLFFIIVVSLIGISIVSYFIRVYNQLVMMRNNVDKSFANIDVLLKQRADEIPNLIKVVKESMNYERSVLEELTKLRTHYLNTNDLDEKIALNNNMDKIMKSIFAVSENYPTLKANNNFISLQQRVSELENLIADRRELYNESVNIYNIGIKEFPPVILAKIVGYHQLNLLTISEEEKEYHGIQF
jgi:LemA protein